MFRQQRDVEQSPPTQCDGDMPRWTKRRNNNLVTKEPSDEDLPTILQDESSSGEEPIALGDSSEDESDEESDGYLHDRQQATEAVTSSSPQVNYKTG